MGCGNIIYDVPPTHVDKFLLLHSGYSIVSRVSSSAFILHWIFRTLLILDTWRYQTRKRNITKF